MIYSTQAYLIQNDSWLFLYRNKKEHDPNYGKYIGVGGKLEPGETPRACIQREVQEESGYILDNVRFRGILYFHYDGIESEKIWIYTSNAFHGTPIACDEGTLTWVKKDDIQHLDVWEGDKLFLHKLLQDTDTPFCYVLNYDAKGNLVSAEEKESEDE